MDMAWGAAQIQFGTHLVAKAPWSDEALLEQVRNQVLPTMQKHGPVVAWIVDDTGIPKKGKHSVGVARQYCGQVGKQDNCRVAVSLSAATWSSSLPIGYRLYLPKEWAGNAERREKTEVPEALEFQTKPEIALEQIRAALAAKAPGGIVLADAAYGINTEFRDGLTELELQYVVGVQSSMTVWEPGKQPLAVREALDQNTPRASSVAFLLRRQQRVASSPARLMVDLSHHPEAQAIDVQPHDLETYDELAKSDDDPDQ